MAEGFRRPVLADVTHDPFLGRLHAPPERVPGWALLGTFVQEGGALGADLRRQPGPASPLVRGAGQEDGEAVVVQGQDLQDG